MTYLNPDYKSIAARLLRNVRLPLDHAPALADALRAGVARMAYAGEELIEENSRGRTLHLVSRGKVYVYVTNVDGVRTKVADLQGPVLIGYLAALDGGIRTASCTVAQGALVLDFDEEVIQQMLERTDLPGEAFRTLVLRAMTAQLASTSRQLATLSS